jgi:hypothetical protein
MGTYPQKEKGMVVATLLLKGWVVATVWLMVDEYYSLI